MDRDFSTIKIDELDKFPVYTARPSWHVDKHLGSGCFMDPPGFPSYFIQHIYTQHGNEPHNAQGTAPQAVILGRVIETEAGLQPNLRRLWNPLPVDHPRVEAWIRSCYVHFGRGYKHPTLMENGQRKTVYNFSKEFQFRDFKEDERFSEEWRQKELAAIEQHNAEVQAAWAEIAVPENYAATLYIQGFYPAHTYWAELVDTPQDRRIGNWWETLAECPTAENCPGDRSINWKHDPEKYCQCCGRGA